MYESDGTVTISLIKQGESSDAVVCNITIVYLTANGRNNEVYVVQYL